MKKILFVLIFCFFFSCERKEFKFSKEMIEKLAVHSNDKDQIVTINKYGFLDLYVRTSSNDIFITNSNYLYESYKLDYSKKYTSFKIFLETVVNNDLIFNENSKKIMLANYFKLNPKIENEYINLGFNEFLKKYSKQSLKKKELELKMSNIESNEFLTISYFLYINSLDVIADDIHAKYYIQKRENSFK